MRKGYFALLAATAAVVGGVHAEEFSLNQPIYAQDAAAPRAPLMALMDKFGWAESLEKANINIYGLVAVSWTYGFDDPAGDVLVGRSFDFEHNDPTFNQLYLVVERTTDAAKAWDMGGKMAWTYGGDARFMHSNGLFDEEDGDEQIDLTELYGEVVVPVGNGLKVKLGKFITPLGYEYVNPSLNAFYSHSFLFGIMPYSHTGVMGNYAFNDQWSAGFGVSRGWDQSLEDNNDMPDFIGTLNWLSTDSKTAAAFNVTVGPEAEANDDWRYAFDFWASHKLGDQVTLGINADYIFEEDAGGDGDDASTYGIAGYAGYEFCKEATGNVRLEWFSDNDRASGFDATMYEATVNVVITPFAKHDIGSNLKIRPEIRLDLADEDVFNGGDDDTQLSFGVDAYFTF